MFERAPFPSLGSAVLPSNATSSGEVFGAEQRSRLSPRRFAKPPCQTFPLRSLLRQLCQRFPAAALPLSQCSPSHPPAVSNSRAPAHGSDGPSGVNKKGGEEILCPTTGACVTLDGEALEPATAKAESVCPSSGIAKQLAAEK